MNKFPPCLNSSKHFEVLFLNVYALSVTLGLFWGHRHPHWKQMQLLFTRCTPTPSILFMIAPCHPCLLAMGPAMHTFPASLLTMLKHLHSSTLDILLCSQSTGLSTEQGSHWSIQLTLYNILSDTKPSQAMSESSAYTNSVSYTHLTLPTIVGV